MTRLKEYLKKLPQNLTPSQNILNVKLKQNFLA